MLMRKLKLLMLSVFVLSTLICIKAQNAQHPLFIANVNETFSTPAHIWTLSKVEYWKNCTICRFMVKSTTTNVYLRLLPGCYIMDNLGNKYDLIESDLTDKAPGKKFTVADEPLFFYMKFPPLQYGASKMSVILPELKVLSEIPVGDGTKLDYNFPNGGIKAARANLWITDITITDYKTIVKFVYDNAKSSSPGYWDWASISVNSTLVANGVPHKLLPGQKKSWQFKGKTRFTFTCEFEPIPKITTDIDFIETPSSSFNIKGIKIESGADFPDF